MKIISAFADVLHLFAVGCTSQNPSPDEVGGKTAQTTSDIKRHAQALAQGVREGWNRDNPLDLN